MLNIFNKKKKNSDDKLLNNNSHTNSINLNKKFKDSLYSNHTKNIGIVYLIYTVFVVFMTTMLSILILVSDLPVQFIIDKPFYNNILIIHATIIFSYSVISVLLLSLLLTAGKPLKKTRIYKRVTPIISILFIIGFINYLKFNIVNSITIICLLVLLIGYIIPEIINSNGNSYVVNNSNMALVYGTIHDLLKDVVSRDSFLANSNEISEIHIFFILLGMAMLVGNNIFGYYTLFNKKKENQKENQSLLDKICRIYLIFRCNPLFWIGGFLVFLFLVNFICSISGIVIIRASSSLLYISLMSRIIFIKILISFILLFISRSTIYWYSTISMSVFMPLFMVPMSFIYFFYAIPMIDILNNTISKYIKDVFFMKNKYLEFIHKANSSWFIGLIRLAGSIIIAIENTFNFKFKPGRNLIILADKLSQDNLSCDNLLQDKLFTEESEFNRKRFIPPYKPSKVLTPREVFNIDKQKHNELWKKLRIISCFSIENGWSLNAIKNHPKAFILPLGGSIDDLIGKIGKDKVVQLIRNLHTNDISLKLLFDNATVELTICSKDPKPIDIKIMNGMNKDILPNDFLKKYLNKLSNDSYLAKFNSVVNKSILDFKKVHVFSANNFQSNNPFYYPFFNQDYVPDINEGTNPVTGPYYSSETNVYQHGDTGEDMENSEESGGEMENFEDSDGLSDGYIAIDQKIYQKYPSIIVNKGDNPNHRVVDFDEEMIRGPKKWDYFFELLIELRASLPMEEADNFTTKLLGSQQPEKVENLFLTIFEACDNTNPDVPMDEVYICTEKFIDQIENLYHNPENQSIENQSTVNQSTVNQSTVSQSSVTNNDISLMDRNLYITPQDFTDPKYETLIFKITTQKSISNTSHNSFIKMNDLYCENDATDGLYALAKELHNTAGKRMYGGNETVNINFFLDLLNKKVSIDDANLCITSQDFEDPKYKSLIHKITNQKDKIRSLKMSHLICENDVKGRLYALAEKLYGDAGRKIPSNGGQNTSINVLVYLLNNKVSSTL